MGAHPLMPNVSAKSWVTDERDRSYIEKRLRRLAEIDAERKRLQRQVNQREERAWYAGGRDHYLADQEVV